MNAFYPRVIHVHDIVRDAKGDCLDTKYSHSEIMIGCAFEGIPEYKLLADDVWGSHDEGERQKFSFPLAAQLHIDENPSLYDSAKKKLKKYWK